MMHPHKIAAIYAALIAFFAPTQALAYIGPGAGLGAIAVTVALLLGVVLLIVGLVWYPLKRMIKGKKNSTASTGGTDPAE